jgi:hypothetical protein
MHIRAENTNDEKELTVVFGYGNAEKNLPFLKKHARSFF